MKKYKSKQRMEKHKNKSKGVENIPNKINLLLRKEVSFQAPPTAPPAIAAF